MISDAEIVKHLKIKEQSLITELNKVRKALEAFGSEAFIEEEMVVGTAEEFGLKLEYIEPFDKHTSYNEKIMWALRKTKRAMYVKDIVDILIKSGEKAEYAALLKRITHNASQLFREGILEADTTQRQYKYSIKKSDFKFNIK